MTFFTTKTKIISGYLLSIVLIIILILYIGNKLLILTDVEYRDKKLDEQKRIANSIINKLNIMEITALSLNIGESKEYALYRKNMLEVINATDTLRSFTTDSMQATRLDSVSMLLRRKKRNMHTLLQSIKNSNSDSIYKQHIKEVIEEYDTIEILPKTRRKIITHTQVRTEQQQKNFFKRLSELFSSKKDSTIIKDTIQEEYIDTISWEHNAADTIAAILNDVQKRASQTKLQKTAILSKSLHDLQRNSLELNSKVQELLRKFEQEEENRYLQQKAEKERIRRNSAYTLGVITILAIFIIVIFITIILKDITQSNKYRKELENSKQRAEDLLKTREQLMLTITHDIKAPTAAILGYAELLEKITNEKRQCFYLKNIQNSACHLSQLVNSLLDFHRLDANKAEVQSITFNPKELFDTLAMSYIPAANNKHLEFRYTCDEKLNKLFIGCPLYIRQIVENIVSNALKFTEKGFIEIEIMLQEETVVIRIKDSGCGMPKEEQAKVFKEFTRLKNAQGAEGFGLGLAISQKLVHLLNGKIDFSSEKGIGTTFNVYIPLKKSEEQNKEKKNEDPPTAPPFINILIIDDDRLQLRLTTAMLEGENINITCCENPKELIKYLENNSYNIILTDIQMPGANGFDILKQIRKFPHEYVQSIPVLAVTARGDITQEEAYRNGFCGCLHKPFTQKELIKAIKENSSKGMHFDFSSLTAFSMDDNEAAKEIMHTFISETEKMQKLLNQALENKDMKKATDITHRILPIFKMIKAEKCIPQLEWLETKRNEQKISQESKEKFILIQDELTAIISEAKRKTTVL